MLAACFGKTHRQKPRFLPPAPRPSFQSTDLCAVAACLLLCVGGTAVVGANQPLTCTLLRRPGCSLGVLSALNASSGEQLATPATVKAAV